MARKKRKHYPSNCSRIDCNNPAITSLVENGARHKLCQKCWELAMDRKDKLAAPPPAILDRKSMAAGEA